MEERFRLATFLAEDFVILLHLTFELVLLLYLLQEVFLVPLYPELHALNLELLLE